MLGLTATIAVTSDCTQAMQGLQMLMSEGTYSEKLINVQYAGADVSGSVDVNNNREKDGMRERTGRGVCR